jgi:hypothetical protein
MTPLRNALPIAALALAVVATAAWVVFLSYEVFELVERAI